MCLNFVNRYFHQSKVYSKICIKHFKLSSLKLYIEATYKTINLKSKIKFVFIFLTKNQLIWKIYAANRPVLPEDSAVITIILYKNNFISIFCILFSGESEGI